MLHLHHRASEGQAQVNQGSMMGLSYAQLDVSTEEMENVDLYMQSLSVPARRNVNNEQVIKGEQNFYKAKCHLCHVTTLHTKPRGSILLNGTRSSLLIFLKRFFDASPSPPCHMIASI